MTQTLPFVAELADSPCSVAECLETSTYLGTARVQLAHAPGVPPDFELVTLGLPLCADHAHLLSGGCTLREFSTGL